ncbi:MAG: pyruvate:ferredoxin (flavodoxin) oxidoreductase [Bacilli bacterium]
MEKIITVDGNEACSRTAYMFTEVAGIYPITPSSPMAELADDWSNKGKLNIFNDTVKVIEMQSEAGAAGLVHGSLQAGALTTTYTASQGLLLMIPNLYKIAGEMLPGVLHVAARSLSTHALSIFGDHQDIYACRQTGFCMLASSSVQDAAILSAVAHLSAIKSSLPFMHFFDGFRTSHEINKIKVFETDDIKDLVDQQALKKFREKAMNPLKPSIQGTAQNGDIYFQATEVRNEVYNSIPDIVNDYMKKINERFGFNYKPFNYYGDNEATSIIVAMGSVTETIKETIDVLIKLGYKIGLIEVHLYRPFSKNFLIDVLPKSVTKIAVMDRTKEAGSIGEPLYLDIVTALKELNIEIVGGRYGLSSKDTSPKMIKAVYDMLLEKPINNFTVGIEDDVTNLSLKIDDNFKINNSTEFLVYGYGSDGMVSASKSIIKLIGKETKKFVQGYFEYDSKKSGGVTVGHLRFSNNPIRSTYYVENPEFIVCTKDGYLDIYNVIDNIKENGIFLLNTRLKKEEIINNINPKVLDIIKKRNIKFYIINAYELAGSLGLSNKISTIMQSSIMYLSDIFDYEAAKKDMKDYALKRYFKKGQDVLNANYKAIDEASKYLEEIKIEENISYKINNEKKSLYDEINERRGDSLPTSSFLNNKDGHFETGTSTKDKRAVSDVVPNWINENCIMCNQCSLYCPHGVIRPFLLSEEEFNNAPEYVKNKAITPIMPAFKEYKYILSISPKDCTGCGICVKNCPGKKGKQALMFNNLEESLNNKEQDIFDYLIENIKEKNIDPNTVINSQYKEPKFAFSGACAGCGETPYLKLLTQLFGKFLMVSNATGCSSIYSGSTPSMPYTIPWASSLFEDNAEYGYGMLLANKTFRNRIKNVMLENNDNPLFNKWIDNMDDYQITKEVYDELDYSKVPSTICDLKDYLVKRSIWTIGGDGWAYDIGYGGIDHVLASNEDVNILVLDSQVYSNTGGQSSKASEKGSIAAFTSYGKTQNKKDLARIAMSYPHVYVATISLGANSNQALKAMIEAEKHKGPSIIIAYSPCISHGIKGGLVNSVDNQASAVKSGYFPIFRYNPDTSHFTLDSKNVDFELYNDFLLSQTRYSMLNSINPEKAETLLNENKENAIRRFNYYKELEEKQEK